MEQNGQVKKKGKKTQSEITTSESAVKKQEEFEEMKKKTFGRNTAVQFNGSGNTELFSTCHLHQH